MTNQENSNQSFDEPTAHEKEVENTERIHSWKIKIGTTTYCEEIFDKHSVDSGHTTLIKELVEKVKEFAEESQDLQMQLEEAEKLLDNLKKSRGDTEKEIKDKEREVQKLKKEYLEKQSNYGKEKLQEKLEKLLKAQADNSPYAKKHKEEIKEKLVKKTSLTAEEIDDLCQTQEELIQLEMMRGAVELGINKMEERVVTIINNISAPVSVTRGNFIMGINAGDNANMNYENYSDSSDQQEWKERVKSLEEEIERLNELLKEKDKVNAQSTQQVEKLTDFAKYQKEKIINAYLHFSPDAELLKELIIVHLEYSKAREQGWPIIKLRRQRNTILDELENKLDEKQMEEIQLILNDCEELVRTELEVTEQLQSKITIEYSQKIQTIINNINISKGHVLIGSSFGDNANLSYNRPLTELPETKSITLPITEDEQSHLITRNKRQLSISSWTDWENNKEAKIDDNQNRDWQKNNSSLTSQTWTNHHFTPTQARDWINTNPPSQQNQASQEPAFYAWIRDSKNLTPEQVLNHSDLNTLRQEYQTQQTAQILHNPSKP